MRSTIPWSLLGCHWKVGKHIGFTLVLQLSFFILWAFYFHAVLGSRATCHDEISDDRWNQRTPSTSWEEISPAFGLPSGNGSPSPFSTTFSCHFCHEKNLLDTHTLLENVEAAGCRAARYFSNARLKKHIKRQELHLLLIIDKVLPVSILLSSHGITVVLDGCPAACILRISERMHVLREILERCPASFELVLQVSSHGRDQGRLR